MMNTTRYALSSILMRREIHIYKYKLYVRKKLRKIIPRYKMMRRKKNKMMIRERGDDAAGAQSKHEKYPFIWFDSLHLKFMIRMKRKKSERHVNVYACAHNSAKNGSLVFALC